MHVKQVKTYRFQRFARIEKERESLPFIYGPANNSFNFFYTSIDLTFETDERLGSTRCFPTAKEKVNY